MEALLSCVIPVGPGQINNYNLIQSISRSNENVKFILVLDSTPASILEELTEYSKSDSRITMCIGNFGSPGLARNHGLGLQESEWVAFFDADDKFFVDDLSREIALLDPNVDAAISNFQIRFSNGTASQIFHNAPGNYNLVQNWQKIAETPGIWRWVFRAKAIEQMQFQEYRMGEDVCFLADFLKNTRRIFFSSCMTYEYSRQNSKQLTKSSEAMRDLNHAFKYILYGFQPDDCCNLGPREDLASLLLYSCLKRLSVFDKQKTLLVMCQFGLQSGWHFRKCLKIMASRFRVKYA